MIEYEVDIYKDYSDTYIGTCGHIHTTLEDARTCYHACKEDRDDSNACFIIKRENGSHHELCLWEIETGGERLSMGDSLSIRVIDNKAYITIDCEEEDAITQAAFAITQAAFELVNGTHGGRSGMALDGGLTLISADKLNTLTDALLAAGYDPELLT